MVYLYTYIYHKHQPNVGEYTIHGSYGYYTYGRLEPFSPVF